MAEINMAVLEKDLIKQKLTLDRALLDYKGCTISNLKYPGISKVKNDVELCLYLLSHAAGEEALEFYPVLRYIGDSDFVTRQRDVGWSHRANCLFRSESPDTPDRLVDVVLPTLIGTLTQLITLFKPRSIRTSLVGAILHSLDNVEEIVSNGLWLVHFDAKSYEKDKKTNSTQLVDLEHENVVENQKSRKRGHEETSSETENGERESQTSEDVEMIGESLTPTMTDSVENADPSERNLQRSTTERDLVTSIDPARAEKINFRMISSSTEKSVKYFTYITRSFYKAKTPNDVTIEDLKQLLHDIFRDQINRVEKNALIGLGLSIGEIGGFTICVPVKAIASYTEKTIENRVKILLQSSKNMDLTNIFTRIITVTPPIGHGPAGVLASSNQLITKITDSKGGRPSLYLKVGERGCCYNAIAFVLLRHEKGNDEKITEAMIRQKAIDVALSSRLPYAGDVGWPQLYQIDSTQSVRLLVYHYNKEQEEFVIYYKTQKRPVEGVPVILCLIDKCYFIFEKFKDVTTTQKFRTRGTHCPQCMEPITSLSNHRFCILICEYCKYPLSECPGDEAEIRPEDFISHDICARVFKSAKCYENHLTPIKSELIGLRTKKHLTDRKTTCVKYRFCTDCLTSYDGTEGRHSCDKFKCKNCSVEYKIDGPVHRCYVSTTYRSKYNPETCTYIILDIETILAPRGEYDGDGRLFIPVLIVAQVACPFCIGLEDKDNDRICQRPTFNCGKRTRVFHGIKTCVHDFFVFLTDYAKTVKPIGDIFVVGFNSFKFDFLMFLPYVLNATNESWTVSNLIMRGTAIVNMVLNDRILFRDVYSYAPGISLRKAPIAFGLTGEDANKTFFPYDYLDATTYGEKRIGAPPRRYFNPENLSKEEQKQLDEHRAEYDGKEYDINAILEKYCIRDVNLTRKIANILLNQYLNAYDIHVFSAALTQSSLSNLVFRTKFLKPKMMTNDAGGGHNRLRFSKKCLQALTYVEHKTGWKFDSAGTTQGEKILRHRRALFYPDGYTVTPEGKTIALQFHGCRQHACECMGPREGVMIGGESATEVYENTLHRDRVLSSLVDQLFVIWECTYDKALRGHLEDEEHILYGIDSYINEDPLGREIHLISSEEFLAGGHTDAFRLLAEPDLSGTERIIYSDVASLYPAVQMSATYEYPVGEPEILTGSSAIGTAGEFTAKILSGEYFGISKVRVLAPGDDMIPILPYKYDNSIYFMTCMTCLQTGNDRPCGHNARQRSFLYSYCTPELKEAIQRGYKILNVYQHWQYEKSNDLFAPFIKDCIKTKIAASKIPTAYKENVQEYCNLLKEHQGILISPEEFKPNPSARFCAKLRANSCWGFLAMRGDDHTTTKVLSTPEEYNRIIHDEDVMINHVYTSENKIAVVYKSKNDSKKKICKKSNVVIAAFVTSHARVMLHRGLCSIKDPNRLLYSDTDSIMYLGDPRNPEIKCDIYIGSWTDELAAFGEGAEGIRFVCIGCKSYALEVRVPGQDKVIPIVKCKGITLGNESTVNYQAMKQLLSPGSCMPVNQNLFKREIFSAPEYTQITRTIGRTARKRITTFDFGTVPIGYQKAFIPLSDVERVWTE